MRRKVTCKNILCKFHTETNGCNKSCIEIDEDGCHSSEHNLRYYFNKVWNIIDHTNMITPQDLDRDTRIGLYFVMKTYNLSYMASVHGTWSWYSLIDENEKALNYKEVIARKVNIEEFSKLREDFYNGILPDENLKKPNDEQLNKPLKEIQPFGWLSPTGDFTESDWGTHEDEAFKIIENNKWEDEFLTWHPEQKIRNAGDFISSVKGYALIHNPSGDGGYNVTNTKTLTKAQKEFLYGYFMDIGNTLKAEFYLD